MEIPPLLRLPRELRDIIYSYILLCTTVPYPAEIPSNPKRKVPRGIQHQAIASTNLLLTSRQISRDVREFISYVEQHEGFTYELDMLLRGDSDNVQLTWPSIPMHLRHISVIIITIRLFSSPKNEDIEVDEKAVVWKAQKSIDRLFPRKVGRTKSTGDAEKGTDTEKYMSKLVGIPSEEEKEISRQRYLSAHRRAWLRRLFPPPDRMDGFLRPDGRYMGTRHCMPYMRTRLLPWCCKTDLWQRGSDIMLYFWDSGELELEDDGPSHERGHKFVKYSSDYEAWDYGWIWIAPMIDLLDHDDSEYFSDAFHSYSEEENDEENGPISRDEAN